MSRRSRFIAASIRIRRVYDRNIEVIKCVINFQVSYLKRIRNCFFFMYFNLRKWQLSRKVFSNHFEGKMTIKYQFEFYLIRCLTFFSFYHFRQIPFEDKSIRNFYVYNHATSSLALNIYYTSCVTYQGDCTELQIDKALSIVIFVSLLNTKENEHINLSALKQYG